MRIETLRQSFDLLSRSLPPGIEPGMPWPRDQGYDVYESPALIYAATQELGGQSFLTGDPARVETFLAFAQTLAEPRVIVFWLRASTFFADDAGAGLQRLVAGWVTSPDPLKSYLARHVDQLVEASGPG